MYEIGDALPGGVTPEVLMSRARDVRENAYAPYSKFGVGAALLMSDGSIFVGCNVENASFGLTVCAERSAMSNAVACGHRDLAAVAVCGPDGVFCPPCGACRQFLAEFNAEAPVFLTDRGKIVALSIDELLAHRFRING